MLKQTIKSDIIGILSSGLCLVHCLILPAILVYPADWHSDHSQAGINYDYLFLLLAFIAVYHTTKKAKSSFIKFSLWAFLLICAAGIVFHDYSPFTQYIVYIGSAGLIISHLFNIRYSRQCC